MMRVLVACEYSATVRDAFRRRGFDAWSCDLLPTEGDPRWHIQGDAIAVAYRGCPVTNPRCEASLGTGYETSGQSWDLLIGHPECTYLCNSGAKHLYAGMKAENGPNASRWAAMGAATTIWSTRDLSVLAEASASATFASARRTSSGVKPAVAS